MHIHTMAGSLTFIAADYQ